MVAISAGLAGSSLGSSIKGEFSGVAAQNGQMVQSIITNASNTATVLQEYMQNMKKQDTMDRQKRVQYMM